MALDSNKSILSSIPYYDWAMSHKQVVIPAAVMITAVRYGTNVYSACYHAIFLTGCYFAWVNREEIAKKSKELKLVMWSQLVATGVTGYCALSAALKVASWVVSMEKAGSWIISTWEGKSVVATLGCAVLTYLVYRYGRQVWTSTKTKSDTYWQETRNVSLLGIRDGLRNVPSSIPSMMIMPVKIGWQAYKKADMVFDRLTKGLEKFLSSIEDIDGGFIGVNFRKNAISLTILLFSIHFFQQNAIRYSLLKGICFGSIMGTLVFYKKRLPQWGPIALSSFVLGHDLLLNGISLNTVDLMLKITSCVAGSIVSYSILKNIISSKKEY